MASAGSLLALHGVDPGDADRWNTVTTAARFAHGFWHPRHEHYTVEEVTGLPCLTLERPGVFFAT